jgi:hypothetical protein
MVMDADPFTMAALPIKVDDPSMKYTPPLAMEAMPLEARSVTVSVTGAP